MLASLGFIKAAYVERDAHPLWEANLQLVGLGYYLGLASLSKLSALGLIALTGLALLVVTWRAPGYQGRAAQLGAFCRMGLAVSLPALAIGGWWYVRNWALYRDPLAWNVWQANILLHVGKADSPRSSAS